MPPRRLRRVADALSLVIVAAILVGTLSPPGSPTATTFGLNPDYGHLGLFCALGVASALRYVVSPRARRYPRSTLAMVFFGFWILAGGTEFLQGFVGRDPSFSDWLIDMGGAALGFIGGSFALRMLLPRRIGPRRPVASPPPDPPPAPRGPAPRGRRRRAKSGTRTR